MSEDIRDQLQPGMKVRIHQRITEEDTLGNENTRTQIFDGMIISRKHGTEKGATITIRKKVDEYGVEKIFPVYSPIIEEVELVRKMKVCQSQPYYLRDHDKKLDEDKDFEPTQA
jgi:large subunit ribosomal protein L19